MAIGNLLDKAKEATVKAKEMGTETVQSAQAKTQGITQKALATLKSLEPVLKNCGYIIGDVKVTMSLPPSFSIIVEQVPGASDSIERILAEPGNLNKVQLAILKGLQDAYALEANANAYGYTIGQIEMEIGLPPKVHVHLNSQSSRAFG